MSTTNFSWPDATLRKQDILRAREELGQLFDQNADIEPETLSPELHAIITANQQLWETSDVASFIHAMDEALQNSPVFDVILPAYPHDAFLRELGGWFRREIHPSSLLRISVRRTIGGGIVVRSKNRIFDLSLRPAIWQSRDRIPEVLRHV